MLKTKGVSFCFCVVCCKFLFFLPLIPQAKDAFAVCCRCLQFPRKTSIGKSLLICLDPTIKSLYLHLEKCTFKFNKWRLEVFAEQQWVILCVPISVYIDGVFVKCYSKIMDCNIDFYFLF